MQQLPHHYSVSAAAEAEGEVTLESGGLPSLRTAPPPQFGGPGDRWSPETLLMAAVAGCFILTFRAIAAASKLPWSSLKCEVEGTLDRVERVMQFTEILVRASLRVPADTDQARAQRLMERAEQTCLVTQSLKGKAMLVAKVEVAS